jgi:hypothetical protein
MIPAPHHLITHNFTMEEFCASVEGLTLEQVSKIKETAAALEIVRLMFGDKPIYIDSYSYVEGVRQVVFTIDGLSEAALFQRREWLNHLSHEEKDAFILEHNLSEPEKAADIVAKLQEHNHSPAGQVADEFKVKLIFSN